MKYDYFIGIDVSKLSFDAAIIHRLDPQTVTHKAFPNNKEGVEALVDFLATSFSSSTIKASLFCMEATGVYCHALLDFFQEKRQIYG